MRGLASPRWEALGRLKTYVDDKRRELWGGDPAQVCTDVEGLGASVNSADTWVGPLADDEAKVTTEDINSVFEAIDSLSEDLQKKQDEVGQYIEGTERVVDRGHARYDF